MTPIVYSLKNIPYDDVMFGRLKRGLDHHYMGTYVKKNDSQSNLYVQTPKMYIASNVEDATFLQFTSEQDDVKEAISKMESYVLDYLKENKETLFLNKGIDDVFLEAGHTSSILKDNRIRFRMSTDTNIFNNAKEALDSTQLKKGNLVKSIVQMVGLWFTANRWGITWKLNQIKLETERNVNKFHQYMFDDQDEEDIEDENNHLLTPPPDV